MRPLDPVAVRLFDENTEVRREAVLTLDTSSLPGLHVLRQVLLTDEDAEVRACAARRLGESRQERFIPALLESARDLLPLVREHSWRALARLGAKALLPLAERALREEPIWWVRRATVRAVGSVPGVEAVELLLQGLEDPFWRVRNAAIQALAWLGDGEPFVREQVRMRAEASPHGPVRAASVYLGSLWDQGTVSVQPPLSPETAVVPERDNPLANDDPAVVTSRLERSPASALSTADLVAWLADPHEPLRALARRRLRERRDPEALLLAMRWLDEPRVPHAADEVQGLLERLDGDEVALAARVLEGTPRPGAVRFAARVAVHRAPPELLGRVRALAHHPDPTVRRAALSGLVDDPESQAMVLSALEDPDEAVREEVLSSWSRRPMAPQALEAHAHALVAFAPRARTARERRSVAEAAAHLGHAPLLARASRDEDPSVRAVALAARLRHGTLPEDEAQEARVHEDPWIRAAVLDPLRALDACVRDPDPIVRRAAMTLVMSRRSALPSERLRALWLAGARSEDPWMRARAAGGLVAQGEELSALLRLSLDSSPGVRAAAASVLEVCDTLEERLDTLLHGPARTEDEEVRVSAYTWLLRRAEEVSFARLCAALRSDREPERVRAHLEALTLVFSEEQLAAAPDIARRRPVRAERPGRAGRERPEPPAHGALRPLGGTGLSLSPLVVSGVHGLPVGALAEAHEAGVNAFFWEPRYTELTRFLRSGRARREGLVVVAGTYHSGAEAIRRDVRGALRLLRTDHLDVFLLFWVRSPERLDAENLEALEALRAEGLLRTFGFSTHHRELAREALREHPWPVVMTRHSAAHPGAEVALFPEALASATGVLTFSATCYGRMLRPPPGAPADTVPPSAVDCYRYGLSQPGVSACVSAPRSTRELRQNLEVLARPWMMPDVLPAMRAQGERVRASNQRFNTLVRQAPGGPRDTFLALLDEEEHAPAEPFSSTPR